MDMVKEINCVIENKINEMSHTAVIDRLSLSCISIDEIDNPDDLDRKGILSNGKSRMKYYTRNGNEFTGLAVKDDYFGRLKAGVNYGSGGLYSKFDTSVKNDLCSNLICNTAGEYRNQIEDARKYLAEEYGIHAGFQNAVINQIELNRTFRIENSITDYKRPIELIAWNIPKKKRMNLMHDFKIRTKDGFNAETFIITSRKVQKNKKEKVSKSRQYEELVFYGKTKQMEKIIFLSEEYLRAEIKITGSAKIKKMIGTNRFYDLTDQYINDFFDREIKEMITDPYDLWKEKRDRRLLKLLKSQRAEKHDWVISTLLVLANEEIKNGVPVILDVSEILPLIDKMGIKDPRRRYKIRESFKRQAEKRADVFCRRDNLKLQELLNKLKPEKLISQQGEADTTCICQSGDIAETA